VVQAGLASATCTTSWTASATSKTRRTNRCRRPH